MIGCDMFDIFGTNWFLVYKITLQVYISLQNFQRMEKVIDDTVRQLETWFEKGMDSCDFYDIPSSLPDSYHTPRVQERFARARQVTRNSLHG